MTARAVLWDVDGTLVLSEPIHFRALRETAAEAGIALPDSFHAEMVGRTAEATWSLIVERYGLTTPFRPWVAGKYRRYVGCEAVLPPRPGAVEAFRALDAAGVPQALVSNSDRIVVETNIRALGLLLPRLVSVALNDVRRGKPDPEPYLRAAHLMGVEPADCVVVEDSGTGAMSGLRAGMTVLGWPETDAMTFPEGVQVIRSVGEALADLGLQVDRAPSR